jgi:MFS family permease
MAQFGAAYTHRGELHGTAALSAVALLLGVAFGLSTLLTPLYLIYQQHFGFSRITLTLIYAVYAIGNVAALLFLGRVSDRIGRRIIALSAIATLAVATLVFLSANGVAALYVGRALTGLGVGIASGTGQSLSAKTIRLALLRSARAQTSWVSGSRHCWQACWRNMRRGHCTCRSSSILLFCAL